MKYIITELNGHDIAVYEKEGSRGPIIFVHGNSLSSLTFQWQFNSEIFSDFRMISIDLPGHGKSSHSDNPATDYSMPAFRSVLFSLLEKFKISEAVVVGHSLGGHILMESLPELESYCRGMVVFGSPPIRGPEHPIEKSHYPNPAFALAFSPDLNEDQIIQLSELLYREGKRAPEFFIDDLRNTDPLMRPNLGMNSSPDKFPNETELISNIYIPLGVFHGKHDSAIRASYFDDIQIPTLWRDSVQMISSGHSPQLENPVEFNTLLFDFCRDVL